MRAVLLRIVGAVLVGINANLLGEMYPSMNRWWVTGPLILIVGAALATVAKAFPRASRRSFQVAILVMLVVLTIIILDWRWIDTLAMRSLLVVGTVAAIGIGVVGFPGVESRSRPGVIGGIVWLLIVSVGVGVTSSATVELASDLLDVLVLGVIVVVLGVRVLERLRRRA